MLVSDFSKILGFRTTVEPEGSEETMGGRQNSSIALGSCLFLPCFYLHFQKLHQKSQPIEKGLSALSVQQKNICLIIGRLRA